MTRMWGVDPTLLCDRHLLGEHAELHQVVGTIRRHPHGEAVVRGHAERGQLDTSRIRARHDALAAELERRGMTHGSPMDYEDVLGLGRVDPRANLAELRARCAACRRRIDAGGRAPVDG